jgi:hypothetical protein
MSAERNFVSLSPAARQETAARYRCIGERLLSEWNGTFDPATCPLKDDCNEPFVLRMRRQILSQPPTLFVTVSTTERREEDIRGDRGHRLMGRVDRHLLGPQFNKKRRTEGSEYWGFAEWTRRNNYHAHFLIAPATLVYGADAVTVAEKALRNVFADVYYWPFIERNWTRFQHLTPDEVEAVAKPSMDVAVIPLDAHEDRIRVVNYATKQYHDAELRDMAMFRSNSPVTGKHEAR